MPILLTCSWVFPGLTCSVLAGAAPVTLTDITNNAITGSNPLPVSGSFSATLSGFAPGPAYATLAVGATTARVALPTGTTVVVYNTGTNPAFVTLGNASIVATATADVIQPGSWLAFTPGSFTYIAAIETGGATNLIISGGAGLPTGAGGGSSTSGGSTSANQTNASQKSQIVDGSGNVIAATSNALNVNVNNAFAAGQTTMSASSPVVIASNQSAVPVSPTTYPATAVPLTASATGTTAATTATLTNVSSHTTYICGFSIRANATAAATGNATVTGTITATMNFTQWTAPLASGLGVTEEVFSPCVPASAVSTSIAVVSAAPGSGGVVSVTAWGYSI